MTLMTLSSTSSQSVRDISRAPRVLRAPFFPSKAHSRALDAIRGVVDAAGRCAVLVGAPGSGKTTVLEQFLADPAVQNRVVLAEGQNLTPQVLAERLERWIQSRQSDGLSPLCLLVDRAELLDASTMQALTDLLRPESGYSGMVSLVLAGRPEVLQRLGQPEAAGLKSALDKPLRLGPMDAGEIEAFLQQSLDNYGGLLKPFTPGALRRAAQLAAGRPRFALTLAARSLAETERLGLAKVDKATVTGTAERLSPKVQPKTWPWGVGKSVFTLFFFVFVGVMAFGKGLSSVSAVVDTGLQAMVTTQLNLEAPAIPGNKPSWLAGSTPPPWAATPTPGPASTP